MSSQHQSLSTNLIAGFAEAGNFRYIIVQAEWNAEVTKALAAGAKETLHANGVPERQIHHRMVPGSFELINAAQWAVGNGFFDVVICLGAIIRGDTPHFHFVAEAVSLGLAQLNASQSVPVIFGVLTTDSMEQALERAGGKHGNKGQEAAYTAIKMLQLRNEKP